MPFCFSRDEQDSQKESPISANSKVYINRFLSCIRHLNVVLLFPSISCKAHSIFKKKISLLIQRENESDDRILIEIDRCLFEFRVFKKKKRKSDPTHLVDDLRQVVQTYVVNGVPGTKGKRNVKSSSRKSFA